TLAMAALDIIRIDPDVVELLIPVTILLTSIYNITQKDKEDHPVFSKAVSANYLLALCFGFIHGMGFSNYFRALLGELESIVLPLFAFNVGLELGQILIVVCFFGTYWFLSRFFTIRQRDWNLFISGAGAGVSAIMILEKVLGG
ncbi:MAG: HupE/UreJ family protein, partial [Saprospiraceae bacterium]|nr:HupE/UreJ family protein [Saprospiraceae bacterium]